MFQSKSKTYKNTSKFLKISDNYKKKSHLRNKLSRLLNGVFFIHTRIYILHVLQNQSKIFRLNVLKPAFRKKNHLKEQKQNEKQNKNIYMQCDIGKRERGKYLHTIDF